jgi:hypothetical protein
VATLKQYAEMAGDQKVTITSGTTLTGGGTITAPHAATLGVNSGYLILDGRGVNVNLVSTTDTARFSSSSSRIILVGFNFTGYPVCPGSNIIFWYCNFTFPLTSFQSTFSGGSSNYNGPDALHMQNSTNCGLYACTFTNAADFIKISGSDGLWIQGCKTSNQISSGSYSGKVWHSDGLDDVNGNNNNFTIKDSYLQNFRLELEDRGGPIGLPATPWLVEDTWLTTSPGACFNFVAAKTTTPRGIYGKINRVSSWNHTGAHRIEIVDSVQSFGRNIPGRVEVSETSVSLTAPTGTNPADRWRGLNTITSYDTFFPFITPDPDDPVDPVAPSIPVAVGASAGDGESGVIWTAPTSTGGADIIDYTVTTRTVPSSAFTKTTVINGTLRGAVIKGLTNGTSYAFGVKARNVAGYGPERVSNTVTPTGSSVSPGSPDPAKLFGPTWKDSTGISPGTISTFWPVSQLNADWTRLLNYGSNVRNDVRWSQVYAGGWRSNSNTGWYRYDQEIGLGIIRGIKKFVICVNDSPGDYGYGHSGPTLPDLDRVIAAESNKTVEEIYEQWCKDLVNRYKPGGTSFTYNAFGTTGNTTIQMPTDAIVMYEIWNEANVFARDDDNQPNVRAYARLYHVAYDAIHTIANGSMHSTQGGGTFVGPTGPAPAPTAYCPAAGDIVGSNIFGYANKSLNTDGSRPLREYSPTDWYRNLLVNPNGILGSIPKINQKFEFLPFHPYWSSKGPLGTHGVTTRNGQQPYNFQQFRNIKHTYFEAVAAGNDPDKCRIFATEIGDQNAPYYSSSTAYTVGDVVCYDSALAAGNPPTGAWNPNYVNEVGIKTGRWEFSGTSDNRAPRYQCHTDTTGNAPTNTGFWILYNTDGVAWSSTTAYAANVFVQHSTQGRKRSKIAVPAGTAITNTTYWQSLPLYGGHSNNITEEENETARHYDWLQKVWFGLIPDTDGVSLKDMTGWLSFYTQRDGSGDLGTSSDDYLGHKFGLLDMDGRVKGSVPSLGAYQTLVNNASRADTRVSFVTPTDDPYSTDCSTIPDVDLVPLVESATETAVPILSISAGRLHITQEVTDSRTAMIPNAKLPRADAEVRSVVMAQTGFAQQGHTHRLTDRDGVNEVAIIVARNILPVPSDVLNVYLMGRGITANEAGPGRGGFTSLGSIDLGDDLVLQAPFFMASRVIGNRVDVKAWLTGETEPAWNDGNPDRTASLVVSHAQFPTTGYNGWYFAHNATPDYMEYDNLSVKNVALDPVTPPSTMGQPIAISADSSARVSWSPPASSGGAPIIAYIIRQVDTDQDVGLTLGDATSTIITDLVNGNSYQFTVRASNGSFEGAQSPASDPVIPGDDPDDPGDPDDPDQPILSNLILSKQISGYQAVGWEKGEPVSMDKISKMSQNDTVLNAILNERPKGLICELVMDPVDGDFRRTYLSKRHTKLMGVNLTLKPNRFYFVEVNIDNIHNLVDQNITTIALYVDRQKRTSFRIHNNELTPNNQNGGVYIPYIWTAPEKLRNRQIGFSVYGITSLADGAYVNADGSTVAGNATMTVTDLGAVFRTEIT